VFYSACTSFLFIFIHSPSLHLMWLWHQMGDSAIDGRMVLKYSWNTWMADDPLSTITFVTWKAIHNGAERDSDGTIVVWWVVLTHTVKQLVHCTVTLYWTVSVFGVTPYNAVVIYYLCLQSQSVRQSTRQQALLKMEVVWVYSYEMSIDSQWYDIYHCVTLNPPNYISISDFYVDLMNMHCSPSCGWLMLWHY
jgi:hypothetical protein